LRVSVKIIIFIVVLFLILFAGFFALTQELDLLLPGLERHEDDLDPENEDEISFGVYRDMPPWIKPARWFRSNAGGMALEEMQSRFAALRNQYALVIDFVNRDELPDYLIPYYNEEYFFEVRILYKEGEQLRTQWIFRDVNANTRLNAVFMEPASEFTAVQDLSAVNESTAVIPFEDTQENEEETRAAQEITHETAIETALEFVETDEEGDDAIAQEIKEPLDFPLDVINKTGFLELFDEKSFLTSEYRYYENGKIVKTEYSLKDNLLIKAEYFEWETGGKEYITLYTDYYRYNRSLSLRNIERVYQTDALFADPVRVAFPRRIMDEAHVGIFISERLNLYPEFFGDVYVDSGSKMVFDTDNRGRIMSQTLYDKDDEVIWTIYNIWQNDRIVTSTKKEGDTVYLAEYAYNSNGDVILERNSLNGVLERVVRTEGNTEIEELYMNNALVLRAVWEEGRKISETRVRN